MSSKDAIRRRSKNKNNRTAVKQAKQRHSSNSVINYQVGIKASNKKREREREKALGKKGREISLK